jgi:hypothetical protein
MIRKAQVLSFCIPISDRYSCAIEAIDFLISICFDERILGSGRKNLKDGFESY